MVLLSFCCILIQLSISELYWDEKSVTYCAYADKISSPPQAWFCALALIRPPRVVGVLCS
jgi:hypothetical protein